MPTREGGWRIELYSDQAPIDFVWVWPYVRAEQPEAEPEPTVEVPAEGAENGVAAPTEDVAPEVTADQPADEPAAAAAEDAP